MTATQNLPHPTKSLTAFPDVTVGVGTAMYRAHSSSRGAWWFDNGAGGRFNLRGTRGTCCTATNVDTAVREKVRDEIFTSGIVSRAFAESFVVSKVTAPVSYRCAAVNDITAVRFMVVRALVTMDDYAVPQAWADAFDQIGFGGVYYETAYTSGGPSAYGLFGDAGAPSPAATFTEALELRGPEACLAAGMKVEGPPPARSLTVLT